jgi:probable selenium-dependent hydroxylase accessory protein YqeC
LFLEHFAFKPGAVVNFVGGGGKTALICALLEESVLNATAIYTTTTRIHPPHPHDGLVIISSENLEYLKLLAESGAKSAVSRKWKLVLTGGEIKPNLLRGVSPAFAGMLDRSLFSAIYNEADGARSVSIKYPREGEPVLMQGAEYLIPVIGVDAIGQPLGPRVVFRWEVAIETLSLVPGEPVSTDNAARMLMHPAGVCRDWKPGTEIVPYINKVDCEESEERALALAKGLLNNPNFPVDRVVIGSAIRGHASSISR